MDNLIIHIGYHKTATSWLQKEFFENEKLNINSIAPYHDRAKWVTEFIKPDYSFDKQVLQEYYLQAVDKSKINVLSIERLSGYPITGGFDAIIIANRLKELFPSAKILISIREQRSMIKSIYLEYLKVGGNAKLEELLYPKRFYLIRNPTFNLDYFKYDYLISEYLKLFGEQNILVLPYEALKKTPEQYISELSSFLGLDQDLSLVTSSLNLKKQINTQLPLAHGYKNRLNARIFGSECTPTRLNIPNRYKRVFNILMRLSPLNYNKRLEEEISLFIEKIPETYYQESNALLEKLITRDLSNYGY
ncbi:Sulfotransferase domain-containing protein [Reichenbachiella agariperforans]|uniref:Sulfotransferase domain-containing protein n=1 Tax=Reichenbachiella agariperforans TaxID=156994 RepID=A0A1M6W4B3_REIAG|nr:sulfotransferase domain-containing protein [Reichenbachiella agariperforans]SHK88543.1 Sulfotransferase domain-containing protein [Reichenbachiella agariperforans]